MATYVNYSTLVSDITAYLERGADASTDETVYEQIPRLINQAERKMMNALKLQGTLETLVDPAGLPASVAVVTKPDRWRQTVGLKYGAGTGNNTFTSLYARSYDYLRSYWPDDTVIDPNNPPKFYADYDYTHWLISPTPDQTYPLEVQCYMQPPLLDDSNQTNFFTDYCGPMLLYGSLLEAAPFLKDDSRIQTWQQLWQEQGQALSGMDLQKILDRAAERLRP